MDFAFRYGNIFVLQGYRIKLNIKFIYIELMGIDVYRTLLEIGETGSFTRVAERRGMTLSAVSMQMKALERELNASLFDRTARPPRLTPLGREIVGHARRVVDAQDALLAAVRSDGPLRGRYRSGFVETASVRLLPEFLKRASIKAPDATFSVETGLSETLQERVVAGHLDFAIITRSDKGTAKLTQTGLRMEELVYALPSGYRASEVERCFLERTFIHFMPDSGIGRVVSGHLASAESAPGRTIFLDSVEACMGCVNAGIGLTILPLPDVERYAMQGVTIAKVADGSLRREIALVTLRGSATDGLHDALRSLFE